MSIIVNNLTKVYGKQKALDNVSLSIGDGEIVGLLGPNGAGKSTMMKILTCFIPPTSGEAKVCGYDIFDNPMEIKKSVGYLSEQNPLYMDMYVREFLLFVAGVHKIERKLRKDRVEEIIALTGLEKEANKKIEALSKGYKQRVGIAQALIHDPKVLILDEPTTGLPQPACGNTKPHQTNWQNQNHTSFNPHNARSRSSMFKSNHHQQRTIGCRR